MIPLILIDSIGHDSENHHFLSGEFAKLFCFGEASLENSISGAFETVGGEPGAFAVDELAHVLHAGDGRDVDAVCFADHLRIHLVVSFPDFVDEIKHGARWENARAVQRHHEATPALQIHYPGLVLEFQLIR